LCFALHFRDSLELLRNEVSVRVENAWDLAPGLGDARGAWATEYINNAPLSSKWQLRPHSSAGMQRLDLCSKPPAAAAAAAASDVIVTCYYTRHYNNAFCHSRHRHYTANQLASFTEASHRLKTDDLQNCELANG